MKWPKRAKHRNKVLAKIYRPCSGRGSYRVAWSVAGKRMMKSFPTYNGKGGALEYAEDLVPELYKGCCARPEQRQRRRRRAWGGDRNPKRAACEMRAIQERGATQRRFW